MMHFVKPVRHLWMVLPALWLQACTGPGGLVPAPLEIRRDTAATDTLRAVASDQGKAAALSSTLPRPPLGALSNVAAKPASSVAGVAASEEATITLNLDQVTLPNFVQVVFGSILKANFSVDPAVSARTDLVTIRTPKPQTPSQVRETARMLLKSYGVAVTDVGQFLRIVPDNTTQGYAPEIRRGRALPETPATLRPIFQLVELEAVQTSEVTSWLTKMYGSKITVQEDSARNALMIGGQSDEVASAVGTVRVLDQPRMRGQGSVRIDPMFWSAQELGNKLNEILVSEGYRSAMTATSNTPIILLPVPAINAIIVFAADPAVLSHIVDWAKELDKPASKGGGFFTYSVRYSDAGELAKTVRELLEGSAAAVAAPAAVPAGATVIGAAPRTRSSRVVVNAATNALIFQGGMEDYTSILNLLQQLDQPAKAALIEVTVAEVNLTDAQQLGVEWSLNNATLGKSSWVGGTLGNLGIGSGGLVLNSVNAAGRTRAAINALANSNRARVLSSPRIMARNGEAATIQVGQEVPVITSQQTTAATGSTGILQSVQYRNTGVILKVKPIIHAGDRIELEVSQEVSSAQSTTTGVASSPTISTRKVDTKLTLRDGATVLLGGLMSSNQTNGDSGIPFLKDVPAVGQLFRVNTDNTTRTELIVLITPYIISDDKDAQAITDAFRSRLGDWAQDAPLPRRSGSASSDVEPPAVVPLPVSQQGAGVVGADQAVPASSPANPRAGASEPSAPVH
jgi:general secretion pathway protein D